MGDKTKIDWCDASWNPVTGCKHGCDYCYARNIVHRYEGYDAPGGNGVTTKCPLKRAELSEPLTVTWSDGRERKAPYPFGFEPTFHRYRLDIPSMWTRPRTIFVCSMADLFGEWVPDEWIRDVFNACHKAPQHRYLFLTKNPGRYQKLVKQGVQLPKDCWIGTSSTCNADEHGKEGHTYLLSENWATLTKWFVSIEPILERFDHENIECVAAMHWVIIGAESGNRKNKVVPEKSWVDEIVAECDKCRTPVFMKESLRQLMGADFRQEFPWEVHNENK